jgi:hypothetical protein
MLFSPLPSSTFAGGSHSVALLLFAFNVSQIKLSDDLLLFGASCKADVPRSACHYVASSSPWKELASRRRL